MKSMKNCQIRMTRRLKAIMKFLTEIENLKRKENLMSLLDQQNKNDLDDETKKSLFTDIFFTN